MNKSCILVMSTDDNYAQHTGVTLCSVLENTKQASCYEIFIVDFNISQENKERLQSLVAQYGAAVHFIRFKIESLKNVNVINRKHISKAAYGKILVPELLDASIPKAVYLDSDIIVLDDIMQLQQTELGDKSMAAVLNPFFDRCETLGVPSPSLYFNSGVLVLGLDPLRERKAAQKILDFVVNHKDRITGADQDPMNAILHHDWLALHPRWNLQVSMLRRKEEAKQVFGEAKLREAVSRPAIIHFTSPSKPWQYMNIHPLKQYYQQYLKKTPWKDFEPGDKTPINRLKRTMKKILYPI